MAGTGNAGVSSPVWASFHSSTAYASSARYSCATFGKFSVLCRSQISYLSSRILVSQRMGITQTHLSLKASSTIAADGRCEFTEEPGTSVKFQTLVSLPGCSSPLTLLGTGYREKVFAIIGVKVYAAGLYVNNSILSKLSSWSGQSGTDIQNNPALFNSIYEDPLEKSLQIVLVRDVDGKTFWDALNDAISPRIKAPSLADESALTTFRTTFEGRPLKKGTFIFLTWLEPSKMLVSISSDGLPSALDATVESKNVTAALFDVFLGNGPVSPTLKASVSNGLASMLN